MKERQPPSPWRKIIHTELKDGASFGTGSGTGREVWIRHWLECGHILPGNSATGFRACWLCRDGKPRDFGDDAE